MCEWREKLKLFFYLFVYLFIYFKKFKQNHQRILLQARTGQDSGLMPKKKKSTRLKIIITLKVLTRPLWKIFPFPGLQDTPIKKCSPGKHILLDNVLT